MARTRTPRPEAQVPVPRQIRSDGWTLPRQRLFLKVLTVSGSVDEACEAAGMSRGSAYRLRLHPSGKAFRDGWARAMAASVSSLREAAFDRALNGVRQVVWKDGRVVGSHKVYNDRLLMFLLRNYDRQGPGGKPASGAAAAWPQDALVAGFDALEPADVPEADIPEPVPEDDAADDVPAADAVADADGLRQEPSASVALFASCGE